MRACVSFPFRCVSCIEISTLDTASIIYADSHEKESRSFPNAECDCRTCIDSDLEVRLPGRISRPLRELPLREKEREREDRVPSLRQYSWKLCARASLDWRVIKFRLTLFRKDAESTFSRKFTPFARGHIQEVAKFIFVPLKCYERNASLIFLAFASS